MVVGGVGGKSANELTFHISNTWSVKLPYNCYFTGGKKVHSSFGKCKILLPAAFRSEVCGSSGEMAARADHMQDTVNVHQQQRDNQSPKNESSEPRSFKKMGSLNLPAHMLPINTENTGNTHPHPIGGRINLLNRNSVTSAIQDSPLSFIKPCGLSFGFHPIFVKCLQSTTKPNSDQMCAYTT